MATIFIGEKILDLTGDRLLKLNHMCSEFIHDSKIFDEIIIAYIDDNHFFYTIHSYPKRRKSHLAAINRKEIQMIIDEIDINSLTQWNYVSTAKGTDFDVICKITEWFYILINNTEMSIDELRQKYDQSDFDEASRLIPKLMKDVKRNLLSGDMQKYKKGRYHLPFLTR